ncbi:hypothetical protein BE08_05005 [Sorangium cellulosum]|uniref:Glycosyltransferase subfamily 4-like N-terminal domain-containing protein n=1 Tax=Sorangium cellulosum TaxID=56 RepID=A0A150PJG2_SORCE|nr:hypothetical protein BE08_05005 [Sorangium cellulosum]
MRICILGKYPPIEGGVSTNTYWLPRGLAERGHAVHVVTNGDEVEEMYRLTLEPDDWPWYEPRFEETGGYVRVYNPDGFSRRAMGHIPEANPFVSKLASLATDVIRRNACEMILAYYYEPYAVAGWLASRWTGRPLITKHAGSDLDRLFRVPDLSTAYKEMLRSADAVVTQTRLMPRFLGFGVPRRRLVPDVAYSIPTTVFHPGAEPLDVERLALPLGGPDARRPRPFDPRVPTVGVYGKIGGSKGTFDLIASLGALARQGRDFNLLAMVGAAQGDILAPELREAGIEERTYLLPMLPNWKVPAFLRACTVVCFLERDFPVAIHGPIQPREVFACGRCLVLSREIAAKQRYRDRLSPGENILIVEDPKDHAELSAVIGSALESADRAAGIGARGAELSRSLEDHGAFVRGWEEVLSRYSGGNVVSEAAEGPPSAADALDVSMRDIVSFLGRKCSWIVEEFLRGAPGGEPRQVAVRFSEFVAERLPRDAFGDDTPKVLAAVRYARARALAAHDPLDDHAPLFAVSDRLYGRPVSRESAWELRPVRGRTVRVEEFDYNVSGLFIESSLFGQEPRSDQEEQLARLAPERVMVLFQRTANLIPCELRIDGATRALVDACDGTRTTGDLVAELCRRFGAEADEQREALTGRLLAALDGLYRANVIVFGEKKPGWGWSGGARSLDGGPEEGVAGSSGH